MQIQREEFSAKHRISTIDQGKRNICVICSKLIRSIQALRNKFPRRSYDSISNKLEEVHNLILKLNNLLIKNPILLCYQTTVFKQELLIKNTRIRNAFYHQKFPSQNSNQLCMMKTLKKYLKENQKLLLFPLSRFTIVIFCGKSISPTTCLLNPLYNMSIG